VFTATGPQGIAAALAAVIPTGGPLRGGGFDLPVIKGIAARLVPLALDEGGVQPDSVQ
jgi:hypothetical protein